MRVFPRCRLGLSAVLVSLAFFSAGCNAAANTLAPESDFASRIAELYWESIGFYSIVLAIVVILIILALTKYSTRREPGTFGPPVHVSEHLALELAWTAGPAAILLLIAFPAIVVTFISTPDPPPPHALEVQVIGHQWWWEFRYPSLGIVTANEPHIPVGKRIFFKLDTADVIHSFWVPRLGGKRDLIPNHSNELVLTPTKIGEYYGECAEFCGLSHANMRMRVFVDSPTDFARWVAHERSGADEPQPGEPNYKLLHTGMQIFDGGPCTTCHKIQGLSKGTIAPVLTHFGSRTTFAGGTLPNRRSLLEEWIADPDRMKPGALMPAMALTPDQLAAVSAYLESLH